MLKRVSIVLILVLVLGLLAGCGKMPTGIEEVSSAYLQAYYTLDIKTMKKLSTGEEQQKVENIKDALKDVAFWKKRKVKAEFTEEKIDITKKTDKQATVEASILANYKDKKMRYNTVITLKKVNQAWRVSNFEEKSISLLKK